MYNVIFMKEFLCKAKPIQGKIDFENCHVAMSKNGGLIAFIKRSKVIGAETVL